MSDIKDIHVDDDADAVDTGNPTADDAKGAGDDSTSRYTDDTKPKEGGDDVVPLCFFPLV